MTADERRVADLEANRDGITTSTATTVDDLAGSEPEFRVVNDPAWRILSSRLLVVRPPSLILVNPLTQFGWDATAGTITYERRFAAPLDGMAGTPPTADKSVLRVSDEAVELTLGTISMRIEHGQPVWAARVAAAGEVAVVYAPSMPDGDVDLAWLDGAVADRSVRWAMVPVVSTS